MDKILQFDWAVFQFVEQYIWADWLTPIMVFFTHLGEGGMIWILISAMFLLTKKYRKAGVTMLCALLVMQIGNNEILKELIARTRPFNLKEWQEIFVFPEMIARPSSWSFPSGHTSSGFAAVTALAITTKKARFAVPGYILAAIIAFTRIYVHVHYCTDILGGIAVGLIYGVLGYLLGSAVYHAIVKKWAKRTVKKKA